MIDINQTDTVTTRHTIDGRFVLFTSADVQSDWLLPWWGVTCDIGGDGFGLLVRLDNFSAPQGWTARQLLAVIHARALATAKLSDTAITAEVIAAIELAAKCNWGMGAESPVSFSTGDEPSAFPWVVARQGAFKIPLCSDLESLGDGITPEQLLIILDQLFHDAARARPQRGLFEARHHIAAALRAEACRVAEARTAKNRPADAD
jgi:hypothetical protein